MGKYKIKGGNRLSGEVKISGAKNAALPILAASVITKGENCFYSCPEISDVHSMIMILKSLGCVIERDGDKLKIDATNLSECRIPEHLMKEMRSSVFLAGSLLARCGEAEISNPGGCQIGKRPIDIHINGLQKLGAKVFQSEDKIYIRADRLIGTDIHLDFPSVGATENLMLAAISARGTTVIYNAAKEPEIVALANYINKCGGKIAGAGTSALSITGGKRLSGCTTEIIPDRIEAGTYLLMCMAAGGEIFIDRMNIRYIKPLIDILQSAGCKISEMDNGIRSYSNTKGTVCCNVSTAPYPGFPTDLQPQLTTFLARCGKGSTVSENIFENRFNYAKQLVKMGADIEIFQKKVIIRSNNILYGGEVCAEDLRGGAALVIAGLTAEGTTTISDTRYMKRGYSAFAEKIRKLGGDIIEYEK